MSATSAAGRHPEQDGHLVSESGGVRHIAVVGAGAAGTLTAMRLLQHAAADRRAALRIWLIDPEPAGRGLAFGTEAPHHLLNVPAGRMSAHRDDPDHFVRWLAEHGEPGREHDFIARGRYGRYLADSLDAASRLDGAPDLVRLHDRVVGITHQPDPAASPLRLRLASGQWLDFDAAVLALGNFAPGQGWAPPALRSAPGYLPDPWAPGALERVADDRDVLLVGTGLTMVDMALTLQRPGRVVHALSRHGLVPQPHAGTPVVVAPTPDLDGVSGLAELRRAVLRQISRCRRSHGDWRAGVDSLRPLTSALWQRLSPADQARLLDQDLRLWETHRHRIPPTSAAALRGAVDAGLVSIGRGTVVGAETAEATESGKSAETTADRLQVRLDNGRRLRVAAVLNCTGSQTDLTRVEDPLVADLLAGGLGYPAPVGGGFDTTSAGRLRPAADHAPAPLWTLGTLRRGNLLESTAIPEIRCQADDLALLLLDRSAVEQRGATARQH
ncbi:FAD/NAD(P)-binding protein [Kitasatospora sp. GAS204B]|uniref:FAD/NAD(P)-binding protein n=1 Tax=unclassified Kitasatospora TaxID=2633591 RepID=UPI002473009C|nr:FAD/NAD(P)-binding protein [Kitasatospora sp. GAS204B]MDH6119395.1 putative NAD(P)/FAD-binding protein YdhS [Kitasatospora sp. GAS204B]